MFEGNNEDSTIQALESMSEERENFYDNVYDASENEDDYQTQSEEDHAYLNPDYLILQKMFNTLMLDDKFDLLHTGAVSVTEIMPSLVELVDSKISSYVWTLEDEEFYTNWNEPDIDSDKEANLAFWDRVASLNKISESRNTYIGISKFMLDNEDYGLEYEMIEEFKNPTIDLYLEELIKETLRDA